MSATGRSAAAGTGYERHPDDDFATPYWCTRAILPHLKTYGAGVALDPCCGAGAILDCIDELEKSRIRSFGRGYPRWTSTIGIEINPERAIRARGSGRIVQTADTLQADWPRADVLVTNPPYSLALPIIERAILTFSSLDPVPKIDMAFLLRINFLGSQKRAEFHTQHPSDIYVLPRRPEFVLSISCKKKKDCGWGVAIPLHPETGQPTALAPVACGKCHGKINKSSSDATEYAWMVWGPGRGNRWFILNV